MGGVHEIDWFMRSAPSSVNNESVNDSGDQGNNQSSGGNAYS